MTFGVNGFVTVAYIAKCSAFDNEAFKGHRTKYGSMIRNAKAMGLTMPSMCDPVELLQWHSEW